MTCPALSLLVLLALSQPRHEAPPESVVTVRGEVRRLSDGAPVERARVVIAAAAFGRGAAAAGSEPRVAADLRTDERGAFSAELEPGRYVLNVRADGLETIRQALRIDESDRAPIVISLAPGATIRGRVVGPEGAPIEGANVLAPPVGEARTGADGSFEIEGIPLDDPSIRLIASARGRVAREVEIERDALERGTLQEVTLSAGRTVTLTVTDEAGRPVEGAEVRPAGLAAWSGSLDEAGPGVYRLTALPERAPLRFDVRAEGQLPHRFGVPAAASDASVVVTSGRSLEGRVVDAEGRPLAGVVVTIVPSDGPEAPGGGGGGRGTPSREPARVETAAGGLFRFEGLAFGGYRLEAVRAADGARGRKAAVIAASGPPADSLEIGLSRPRADVPGDDASQIAWEGGFDRAFDEARRASRPVFVAVSMDNETANDAIAATHFRDPRLVAVTRAFVCLLSNPNRHAESGACPRYGAITCSEHQAIEVRVRTEILGTESVVAPQHFVLTADRDVVARRMYLLSVSDLTGLLLRGFAAIDPDGAFGLAAERIGASGVALKAAKPGSPLRLAAIEDVALLAATGDALARVALSGSGVAREGTVLEAETALGAVERVAPVDAAEIAAPFLDHPEPSVRLRVAAALSGAAPGSPAFDALVERLAAEDESACREALARALGVDLPAGAIPELPPDARSRLLASLGRAGVGFAIPLLGEELESGDPDRVLEATLALAHVRVPAARLFLEARLAGRAASRGAAARSLGVLGDRDAIPVLRRALKDADPFVRAQSARALGALRDGESASALAALAAGDPVALVRVEAAGALKALGSAALRALEGHRHSGGRAAELLHGATRD